MSRAVGRVDVSSPAEPEDHAAWAYASDAERGRIASAWIAAGMRIGQRGFYVADASPDQLLAELAALPDAAAAVGAGALVVAPSRSLYDLSRPIDPEEQLAAYADAVDEAIADGFRGVRVAADITPLVLDPDRRASHLHWEQVAERYIAEHPLAPACLYDTRVISDIDAIVHVHPLQSPVEASFAVYGAHARGAAIHGELDGFSADILAEILQHLPANDDVIDLTSLSFIDGNAASTLHAELGRRRDRGHAITLTGAADSFRRVWDLCGLDPALLGGS